jgi:hypothetical protein
MQTRAEAHRQAAAGRLQPPTALRLLALAGLLPVVWQWAQLADERTKYSLLTSAAVSVLGFFGTLHIVPLVSRYTLKAGLFGMDINKKGSREGEKKVPESLGLASGVVFLVRRNRRRCRLARFRCACIAAMSMASLDDTPQSVPVPCFYPQICIVLFQQLHYHDIPSLVHSLRTGKWADILGSGRKTQVVSDAW